MLLAIAEDTAGAITVGVGITAYTLGLRHAFDADHIAAIDNTTRKLMSEGGRPLSVGSSSRSGTRPSCSCWRCCSPRAWRAGRRRPGRVVRLQETTGLVGTLVSGSFLYVIGLLNRPC